jgi:hypothetical protein
MTPTSTPISMMPTIVVNAEEKFDEDPRRRGQEFKTGDAGRFPSSQRRFSTA